MGIGIGFRTDFGRAQFSFLEFSMHYHPKGDGDECPFRFGICIGLFGVHLDFGLFQDSWE